MIANAVNILIVEYTPHSVQLVLALSTHLYLETTVTDKVTSCRCCHPAFRGWNCTILLATLPVDSLVPIC